MSFSRPTVHVGREALRRRLRGYVDLYPGEDGNYVAKARVLPLAVLLIEAVLLIQNAALGSPKTALVN